MGDVIELINKGNRTVTQRKGEFTTPMRSRRAEGVNRGGVIVLAEFDQRYPSDATDISGARRRTFCEIEVQKRRSKNVQPRRDPPDIFAVIT